MDNAEVSDILAPLHVLQDQPAHTPTLITLNVSKSHSASGIVEHLRQSCADGWDSRGLL